MNKQKICLMIPCLLLAVLLAFAASAEQAAPAGEVPGDFPAGPDSIKNHMSVQFLLASGWQDAEIHLLYGSEGEVTQNGALMSTPLEQYLEDHPAPSLTAGDEPFYRITSDSYAEVFSSSVTFYFLTEGKLEPLTRENREPAPCSELPPATYLMTIRLTGSHERDNYSGLCMVWVTKPEA